MQTGGETQTVTVEAQTPLLQADNATVSSTVTAKAVQDLPLNGRNFVQLVATVPGANQGRATRSAAVAVQTIAAPTPPGSP